MITANIDSKKELVDTDDIDLEEENIVSLWRNNGYFGSQECAFFIDECDIPENTILHINQAYSSCQLGERINASDVSIFGQIVPFLTQPKYGSERVL